MLMVSGPLAQGILFRPRIIVHGELIMLVLVSGPLQMGILLSHRIISGPLQMGILLSPRLSSHGQVMLVNGPPHMGILFSRRLSSHGQVMLGRQLHRVQLTHEDHHHLENDQGVQGVLEAVLAKYVVVGAPLLVRLTLEAR